MYWIEGNIERNIEKIRNEITQLEKKEKELKNQVKKLEMDLENYNEITERIQESIQETDSKSKAITEEIKKLESYNNAKDDNLYSRLYKRPLKYGSFLGLAIISSIATAYIIDFEGTDWLWLLVAFPIAPFLFPFVISELWTWLVLAIYVVVFILLSYTFLPKRHHKE